MNQKSNIKIFKQAISIIIFSIFIQFPLLAEPVKFLSEKKLIPAHLEWNREIIANRQGKIMFRVTSEQPFTVTLINKKGYNALLKKDSKGFSREDIVLMIDSPEPLLEKEVELIPDSYWFIIENRSNENVEFNLECFGLESN
ncbi:MAG: hypothetical protein ACRC2R_15505 [Xenococcaceae cyanobacterium]